MTIIQYTLTLPTDEELEQLSNEELMKCVKSTFDRLNQASAHGENLTQKTKVYAAFEDERRKRLKLVHNRLGQYFV